MYYRCTVRAACAQVNFNLITNLHALLCACAGTNCSKAKQETMCFSNSLDALGKNLLPQKISILVILVRPTLPTPGVSFTLLTALNKHGGAGGGEV